MEEQHQSVPPEELLGRLKRDLSSLASKNEELERTIAQVLSSRRFRLANSIANLSSPLTRSWQLRTRSHEMLRGLKRQVRAALGMPRAVAMSLEEGTIFIPYYQLFARPGTYSECVFGWNPSNYPMSPRDLLPESAIEFTIRPLENGYLGMHLSLGTHGRTNSCTIVVELFNCENGQRKLLTCARHAANNLIDNHLNFIPFPAIVSEHCEQLLVRISSPDALPGNCVAVWGNALPLHALKRSRDAFKDCVNFYNYPPSTTPFLTAPRDEQFFPRFTASYGGNLVAELVEGWQGVCFNTAYLPIYPNSSAEITFQCSSDHLAKIVLSFATFGRCNTCHIKTKLSILQSGNWIEHHELTTSTRAAKDNAAFIFEFPEITQSAGKWVRLTVSSDDASPTNCIGVQGTVLDMKSEMYRRLPHAGDMTSMVDTSLSLANLEDHAEEIPPLDSLLRDTEPSSVKVLVVIDDMAGADIFQTFSDLKNATIVRISDLLRSLERIAAFDLVILARLSANAETETLLQATRRCCLPSVYYPAPEVFRTDFSSIRAASKTKPLKPPFQIEMVTDFLLCPIPDETGEHRLCYLPQKPREEDLQALYRHVRPIYRAQRLPSISLVSILYGKENEILTVLESIKRQDYPGSIEILLVDDCSPDKSRALVEQRIADEPTVFGAQGRMPIRILTNHQNIGNCGSRNRALEEARGDIVLIIDADCVLNTGCLRAHAHNHSVGDVDVVIGTHNLESNHRDAFQVLSEFELDPLKTQQIAQLQDATVPQSFLNSITRNVSIRRSFIKAPLFDELFSYSKNPESGFGWEDVEMGYRLYKQGARIRYNNRAISVHLSHPSSCVEETKPARSIRNFRRLLDKHPELINVSRRWVIDTFDKICRWMENSGITENADRNHVEYLLRGNESVRHVYNPQRSLRIVSFRWHCPHQYEIYKMPHQFSLLKGLGQEYSNGWAFEQRPLLPNVRFKDASAIDLRDFDVAILHFDENLLFTENTNGILGNNWGGAFRWLRENANLPMVAICHGTPQFRGQYIPDYDHQDLGQVLEYERKRLVDYLGDIPVVCNSHQARAEWRFKNSRVIWHGFDPMEFGPAPTGHGILTLGEAMSERPLYRGYPVYQRVRELLPKDIELSTLSVPRPALDYHSSKNDYAYAKFRLYNQAIRKSSIYFNPTIRSPMPRSRGESMMSGLVSVSMNNHDVSLFIKNGINGYYSNEPEELVEYLEFLMRNEAACRSMGERSRALASDIFNIDRFHRDWKQLLIDVGV